MMGRERCEEKVKERKINNISTSLAREREKDRMRIRQVRELVHWVAGGGWGYRNGQGCQQTSLGRGGCVLENAGYVIEVALMQPV